MRRTRQIDFFENKRDYAPRRHKHGGSESRGKRKLRRPLDPKKPLTVTALIARQVTNSRRGKPFGKPFWDHLAFTRVIHGWSDRMGIKSYLWKNEIQRNYGTAVRQALEEFEHAVRKARGHGIASHKILESG